MKRRTYLGASGLGGLSALAGCLDSIPSVTGDEPEPADGAVLLPPDREHDLSGSAHPTYGDEVPSFLVPDALSGEIVSDEDFSGERWERVQLYTFVYTNCNSACPILMEMIKSINDGVRDAGYQDESAFAPFTFDPHRDTPEVIKSYVKEKNIDPSASDWWFLRPLSQESAYNLIVDQWGGPFGLPITGPTVPDKGSATGTGSNETTTNSIQIDADGYMFDIHYDFILLVNEEGIVERSYPGAATRYTPMEIEDDMLAVIEG